MISVILILVFVSIVSLFLAFLPVEWDSRPRLKGLFSEPKAKSKRKSFLRLAVRNVALFNRPLSLGPLGRRIHRDLILGHVKMTVEEFLLLKEILILISLAALRFWVDEPGKVTPWILISIVIGYFGPEYWLRGKIRYVKDVIIKELPDAIDLLRLCVNAGLDFMLALKWVVDKSPPSVMIVELNTMMQEISVGKTRREAIKDLARKYEIPELSSFARTLVQADKMGTSVADALNVLSEDMRIARFRRGERLALKAPLKMLVPLLFFIFPVVGVLVGGPVMIDFVRNNPFQKIAQ